MMPPAAEKPKMKLAISMMKISFDERMVPSARVAMMLRVRMSGSSRISRFSSRKRTMTPVMEPTL